MAIQSRRGVLSEFKPNKMLPGEFAFVLGEKRKIFAGFGPNSVQELAFKEDIKTKVSQLENDKNFQTADNVKLSLQKYLLTIYPVGSIYTSTNSTSPESLFGGKWEAIQGKFLFAQNSTHQAGTTGGEETHKLTVQEMPAHEHDIKNVKDNSTVGRWDSSTVFGNEWKVYSSWENEGDYIKAISTGGNQPHNNMPPYLTVYMWKRVS